MFTTHQRYILLGAVFLVGLGFVLHENFIRYPIKRTMHASYAADFADDNVLVGASHYIFVGKVIRQIGSKKLGKTPETQFLVQVIENIKGDLREAVVVNQIGGYENGILYSMEYDTSRDDSYMLKAGSTYMLATRYNEGLDWYTLNTFPSARKLLSRDSTADERELKSIAQIDARVLRLRSVYPHEVLLSADIERNNARNNYNETFTGEIAGIPTVSSPSPISMPASSTLSDPKALLPSIEPLPTVKPPPPLPTM